jgi:hypothetical protein
MFPGLQHVPALPHHGRKHGKKNVRMLVKLTLCDVKLKPLIVSTAINSLNEDIYQSEAK